MVVNFKTQGISRGIHKLAQTSTLIKKTTSNEIHVAHRKNVYNCE